MITESLEIPYLATTWVPLKAQASQIVQIYPDAETFEAAVVDVVNYYSWPQVTVIYDSKEGKESESVNFLYIDSVFCVVFLRCVIVGFGRAYSFMSSFEKVDCCSSYDSVFVSDIFYIL